MDIPTKRQRSFTRDALAVLVALAEGPQIGSEIQSQIIGDTIGHYTHNSSLYDVLHRLENRGYIAATGKRYALTDTGWLTLKSEVRMLKPMMEQATRRLERHEATVVMVRTSSAAS